MHSNAQNSKAAELELDVNDLGPLAWVLDELRKSLDGATKALKRFVRDAEAARGSDLAALDSSQLRIARQQLHQAVGALEMVGLPAPAIVLRAMESAVQRFIQQPEHCNPEAALKIERASFALTEYLQGVLSGRSVSAVSLFPQYREVQELVKADRIHPADLWQFEWRWLEPEFLTHVHPREYGKAARAVLDQSVLQLMKGRASQSAAQLREISLEFAAAQNNRKPRIFWTIASAYFEALAQELLQSDLYVRRASSRILLQYAALAKGELSISDRLAEDLLFFCSQAEPKDPAKTPLLCAVLSVYGLARASAVNYELIQFGRFDPALLSQARKRITSAKETWSSLCAGDLNKFKSVVDQFSLVTDSLVKLHPPSEPLASALTRAVDTTVRLAQPPRIELAMEVATSLLYLEAAFDDLDPHDPLLSLRTLDLAERLEGVRSGGEPQPLESWMEELYSRVSDKQTMGSVVGELRLSLSELEKSLDMFFRDPADKVVLQAVPGQLSQMRGVFSVLGLEQASQAVARMREAVEEMLITEVDEVRARAAGTFDQLGNNVGALSFLIDMLNYQPVLAKKLFVYDAASGELKPLMGRAVKTSKSSGAESVRADALSREVIAVASEVANVETDRTVSERLIALADEAALAEQPALAKTAREASLALSTNDPSAALLAVSALSASALNSQSDAPINAVSLDFEEDDLKGIFLEEACEVMVSGRDAIRALSEDPQNVGELTVLRRAFHTLKGSSRMVGLNRFGEAAWSLEQLLNSWLADQKAADEKFRAFCNDVFSGFERWIADIALSKDADWHATPFCVAAESMRTSGSYSGSDLSAAGVDPAKPQASSVIESEAAADFAAVNGLAFDVNLDAQPNEVISEKLFQEFEPESSAVPTLIDESVLPLPEFGPNFAEFMAIDFGSLSALSASPVQQPAVTVDENSAGESSHADEVVLGASPLDEDAQALDVDFGWSIPATHEETVSATEVLAPVAEPMVPESDLAELDAPAEALLPAIEEKSAKQNDDALQGMPIEAHDQAEPIGNEEDEQVKVIGGLRIGIPLYNVYLNEADEWSRRLVTEVAEWSMQQHQAVDDSTIALAHSLAGSSATVGFSALSEMARAFESALQQSRAYHSHGAAEYGPLFVDASEDIRRLLHQFAAGFLKEPDAHLLEQLKSLEFSDSVFPPANEVADFDFLLDDIGPENPVDENVSSVSSAEFATPDASFSIGKPVAVDDALSKLPASVAASVPRFAVPAQRLSRTSLDDGSEGDDDIDAIDAMDADLFPIFEEEASELMPHLGGALRQWAARPDNGSARMEVLRALHTLKGSARLAGAMRLGEMAHRIESEIESIGSDAAAQQDFDQLLARFDGMQLNFDGLRTAEAAGFNVLDATASDGSASDHADDQAEDLKAVFPEPEEAGLLPPVAPGVKIAIPAPQEMVMRPLRQAAAASVRVRSQLLDRMVNQAGEVMITRSRLEAELGQLRGSLSDMSGNLNRLRQQLKDIELQAETQMQSRLAQSKEAQAEFDPLEFDRFTRVQELTRMMAESVNDVATVQRTLQRTVEATEDDLIAQARQTRELQRDLLRTRMVEFEGISDRLYRVVRQASKDTGKQVRLDLLGGTIEMDRGMLDRMTPAFEHLLRNCVAHGIEDAKDRLASGKDPVGLITVHLRHDGNDVSVDFSDDGAGLNVKRIHERAIALGFAAGDQPFSDQDAANLIFTPGFSTAAQVTELSGRGIGMEVVRSEVNALGGRIETSTVSGQGTHFKLVLPLTTAVTQVVMIRSGSLSVGAPANIVETVRRTTVKELKQAYSDGFIHIAGEDVPFFWSGALLQASVNSAEPVVKTASVVIFRSAAQRIALHVDEVLGNREVVVKNLGPQLSRLPGLAGMSVLASGAVVLIYNPVALASIYGAQARAWNVDQTGQHDSDTHAGGPSNVPRPMPVAAQIPLILVVDDSITVRRVTQRLLQREGYRVSMAADGLQALERLQEEIPAVVLSDIEMPRMDGFDLARNIRGDTRLKGLPIIMITSRIAEKHREHAMELGVNHYLGKPYSEEELVSLVRHYCAVEAEISA